MTGGGIFLPLLACGALTGVVLILEMSGNFNHPGSLVLVSLSAFVTSEMIKSRPVYTVLLERMVKTNP